MSRGPGWLQRRLLELIEKAPTVDTFTLTVAAFDITPDESGVNWLKQPQHASVRRALLMLERGKIKGSNGRSGVTRCHMWVTAEYFKQNPQWGLSIGEIAAITGWSKSTTRRDIVEARTAEV